MTPKIVPPLIYCMMNTVTQRKYVGSTSRYSHRKRDHLCRLRKHYHTSALMQEDYDKFGEGSFVFFVLEEVRTFDREELFGREQHWIDQYAPEYNVNPVAGNYFHESARTSDAVRRSAEHRKGLKQSPEWIAKRIATMQKNGKHKQRTVSDELRQRLSEINTGERNPNYGSKWSDERTEYMRKKMSRTEYTFLSPDDEEIRVRGLEQWCKDMGIYYSAMQRLVYRKIDNYNGWRLISIKKD